MNVTKGLSVEDYVAQTFCDFGEKGRRVEIRKHYDYNAAKKVFGKIVKVYGRVWPRSDKATRVWQETRNGTILNDLTT